MNITLVPVQDVDTIWPRVSESIVNCLRKAPMEIGAGDIWANCRSGQWLLLIAHDGGEIFGTTVWRFAGTGHFECVVLAGKKLDEWFFDVINMATRIAKDNGCRGLGATGRVGLFAPIKKLNPKAKMIRATYALEF